MAIVASFIVARRRHRTQKDKLVGGCTWTVFKDEGDVYPSKPYRLCIHDKEKGYHGNDHERRLSLQELRDIANELSNLCYNEVEARRQELNSKQEGA